LDLLAEVIGIFQQDSDPTPPTTAGVLTKATQCELVDTPEANINKRVNTRLFPKKHGIPMFKLVDNMDCIVTNRGEGSDLLKVDEP